MEGMLFVYDIIPTAYVGAGVGRGSPHNGSVSYPMRPAR